MNKFTFYLLPSIFLLSTAYGQTEEKVHKLSEISPKCKQLSNKVFNCLPIDCTFVATVDGIVNHWTISVNGPQKKLCKITATFDNQDVTKSNTFIITKLERNNLAAYLKEYFAKPERKIARSSACCSESKATKKFCNISVNGKNFLDILDDRPYFGCDGAKLFEVEQYVIGKHGDQQPGSLPGPDTPPLNPTDGQNMSPSGQLPPESSSVPPQNLAPPAPGALPPPGVENLPPPSP